MERSIAATGSASTHAQASPSAVSPPARAASRTSEAYCSRRIAPLSPAASAAEWRWMARALARRTVERLEPAEHREDQSERRTDPEGELPRRVGRRARWRRRWRDRSRDTGPRPPAARRARTARTARPREVPPPRRRRAIPATAPATSGPRQHRLRHAHQVEADDGAPEDQQERARAGEVGHPRAFNEYGRRGGQVLGADRRAAGLETLQPRHLLVGEIEIGQALSPSGPVVDAAEVDPVHGHRVGVDGARPWSPGHP